MYGTRGNAFHLAAKHFKYTWCPSTSHSSNALPAANHVPVQHLCIQLVPGSSECWSKINLCLQSAALFNEIQAFIAASDLSTKC